MTNSDQPSSTYRILDAAINRAAEGLRVVEDYTRMVMNDSHLSVRLKQLRHDLAEVTHPFDRSKRIASRESQEDVGRNNQANSEYQRSHESGVVQANMSRVAQAFRTIEEFSKTLNAEIAKQVEQLRYESYVLEKAVLTTMMSVQSLSSSQLYVLLDARQDHETLKQFVVELTEAGVDLFQLRDKSLGDRDLVQAGLVISDAVRGTAARWIMNDRSDLAVAAHADGVHLGQEDLKVADARRVLGPSKLIGVSTHSLDQARQAVIDGANYIGVGPVFPTTTKSFEQYVGPKLVRRVVNEIQTPAFAIGGIGLENLETLIAAGCSRVAISGAIVNSRDPVTATSEFTKMLKSNRG